MDTVRIDTLSLAEASASVGEPRWVRDALALPMVQRLFGLVSTLGFFLRSPHAFGRAWMSRSRDIPNPLVAMAGAVSIVSLLVAEFRRVMAFEAHQGLLLSIADGLGPYVTYLVMGTSAHLALRVLGSKRRLGTSIGVSLLAGALPGTVVGLIMAFPIFTLAALYGSIDRINELAPTWAKVGTLGVVAVVYIYYVVVFDLALAGAHGVARWKGVVAGIVGIVVTGFLSGGVHRVPALDKYADKLGPRLTLGMPAKGSHAPRFNFEL